MKYDLVYSVSISGKEIGYVENKTSFEERIEKEIINQEGSNIAFVEMTEEPQYNFQFVSKSIEINEEEVLQELKSTSEVTYKMYAVLLDGEQRSIVSSLEDAEKIVDDLEEEYSDSVDFKIGIQELYTKDKEEYEVTDIKTAENEISDELQEIEDSSVEGIYLACTPISGVITSRFGSRESIRSYAHTGLDVAAPTGTEIKAAADGEIICSEYRGSYGNLIIISHGNGVVTYYGHCSELYGEVGEKVKAGDTIAAVGSTGNSTGPHLHFEIRVNDEQVDPQNYLYNE